jgi:O-antigen/teichoic acid export membrane protein
MIKKLFSHSAIYGLAPQIPQVANLLILPFITPFLSETDYGIFGIIAAYISGVSVFQFLGMRILVVNSYFHYPKQYKWYWRQLFGFLQLWGIIFSFALAVILYFIIPKEAQENIYTIILLNTIPSILFGPLRMIIGTYYQLEQKPLPISIRTALIGVLTVILNYYFIAQLKLGYMGWIYAGFITSITANLSFIYPLLKLKLTPIFNFKWRLIKKGFKVSLPTIPHYYSSYLLDSSDRIVMDKLDISTEHIGLYNVAYAIGGKFKILGNSVGLAVGPMLRRLYQKEDYNTAKNLIFFVQAFFLVFAFLAAIWLKEVFYILIQNEQLREVYPYGILILMGYNYRPFYLGWGTLISHHEKTNMIWKITVSAGVMNVVLNIIFIPIFGIKAAVISTLFSLLLIGYGGYFSPTFKKINTVKYYPILWMILTLLITFVAYYVVEFSYLNKSIISFITLATSVFYLFKYKYLLQ